MGSLRYVLAVAVVFSHIRLERLIYMGWDAGSIGSFHMGAPAVMVFCCISGFVMTKLIRKHYISAGNSVARMRSVGWYYVDRIARLLPQYAIYMLIAMIILQTTSITTTWTNDLSAADVALNFLMIPLGFYHWIPSMGILIPQAWSLGLEWCFYLLAPWILLSRNWCWVYRLGYASLAFYLLPFFGLLKPIVFGYTLLPGVLFIFVVGMAQDDTNRTRRQRYEATVLAVTIILLTMRMTIPALDFEDGNLNKEVLLGAIISVIIARTFQSAKTSRADTWLGNLSYGVFLNHLWVDKVLIELFPGVQFRVMQLLLVVVVSSSLSAITYWAIERPVLQWRRGLRVDRSSVAHSTDVTLASR
jgi:peptidoglycan/LPS O-acetylase OafA/YrhL